MQDFLISRFFDGLTIEKATEQYERFYKKAVPARSLQIAVAKFERATGRKVGPRFAAEALV